MRHKYFILLLCVAVFASCANVEEVAPPLDEQEITSKTVFDADDLAKMNWRYVTEAEIEDMVALGWLGLDKANSCQWKDGVGGSVECNGGSCSVVSHAASNGNNYVGLLCSKGGEPDVAGAWRRQY